MKKTSPDDFHILAIDTCEHILTAIKKAPISRKVVITSRRELNNSLSEDGKHLVVVGVARFPTRRLFLNRLKYVFPHTPILFLFLEKDEGSTSADAIRGEFLISDRARIDDLATIEQLRGIFPLKPCKHLSRGESFRVMQNTLQIITENYSDPSLSLTKVARQIPMSQAKLSRILNKEAGSSFRQLLKQVRIEEAKLMLASHKYTVKEVSARTGFSDSHYFSRSFKEVTGVTASEYKDSV